MKKSVALAALASLALASPLPATLDVSSKLQNVLQSAGNPLYTYPTDLTRGIVPKQIHSHNDYWRDVPFYTALSAGAISVEADVWLVNETLFVGHEQSALTAERTFSSLYIAPILDTLERQNPTTPFISGSSTKNGVFDTSSGQTLYLFVDIKTDGETAWPYVVEQLQPLRDAGYLTTFNGSAVTTGPVTVVGTGNTPLDQIKGVSPRDYFFDANLAFLNTTQADIDSTISPIASTQFSKYIGAINGTTFSDEQLTTLREYLTLAASRGIGGRFWDTPAWPITKRNAVWSTLLEEGVALLNADNLYDIAGFGGVNGYW
ncbi:hypothetical protein DV735_g1486, partial [Chaetothyriales sp. CBS 134920]